MRSTPCLGLDGGVLVAFLPTTPYVPLTSAFYILETRFPSRSLPSALLTSKTKGQRPCGSPALSGIFFFF